MQSVAQGASAQAGVDRDVLLRALRALLPPASVLARDEELAPYECDGLSAYRRRPLVVVLPDTV